MSRPSFMTRAQQGMCYVSRGIIRPKQCMGNKILKTPFQQFDIIITFDYRMKERKNALQFNNFGKTLEN